MRIFYLLLLALTVLTIVDARRKRKDREGRQKNRTCTPKRLKKAVMQYDKCLHKGFESALGCHHESEVKKPLSKKQIKHCTKIENAADACGHTCPTDGGWSPYGAWSDCSAECAGGTQTRNRTCDNPLPGFGGEECHDEASQTQDCNMDPCAVDGNWSEYGAWSDCSAECGGGSQSRGRTCDDPAPLNGGSDCEGVETQEETCNNDPCAVDGEWSEFGDWSDCSTECGGGSQFRLRNCDNPAPAYGGVDCEGEDAETLDCNTQNCPVDGNWSNFGDWSECSATCGGGKQSRMRNCDNPAPEYDGALCEGVDSETAECNTDPCPVDGVWSPFGDWSECSFTCGGGSQSRSRTCDKPAPAHGGANCEGDDSETETCNEDPCPVNGHWSPFGEWSDCTTDCGGGTRTRTRACDTPAPAFGGEACLGEDYVEHVCNPQVCPVRYEFTHVTSASGKWDGGSFSGYFYTVIGGAGETAEHDCESERVLGESSSCVIEDFNDIGDIKGLRIRNSGDNTWRFVKIDVTIDGVYGGTYEGYTSVDDYATVTVPILGDTANPECGRKSLGCYADSTSRAIEGGMRFHSESPIEDCERYAQERGFSVFAVQFGNECFTAANAEETYNKYGDSADCADGRGGTWALNAYKTDSCKPTYECGRESLGCWKDSANRAIKGGVRFSSENPVKECEKYATDNGFSVFAVQFGSECFTADDAIQTYQMYGPGDNCKDGRGGAWAQSVYKSGACPETAECARKNLGCWKDDPLRAIQGGIRLQSDNPIEDCEKYASENGFAVFAVQYGNECFTAENAAQTYQMYGPSEGCQDGRGGTWAQNIYKAGTC